MLVIQKDADSNLFLAALGQVRNSRTAENNEKDHSLGVVFFIGGANRTRTYDPIDVNDVLYQLSHGTMRRLRRCI